MNAKAYTPADVLRLARRVNNTKRSYLLVNPLQGKHMPVSPSAALDMMRALGMQLMEKYPDTRLVVGFAETATAIGAAVASCFPDGCVYMHTTREDVRAVKEWILFQEEHSHAPEQKLAAPCFLTALRQSPTVLFIEDEISTGRTLRNMICQLRALLPAGEERRMVAASIINRMSPENERLLRESGIGCECLVRLPEEDCARQAEQFGVTAAQPVEAELADACSIRRLQAGDCGDPRQGVGMTDYRARLSAMAENAAQALQARLPGCGRLLVLGTEECMYPALVLGERLEALGMGQVRCHATTRSPIGVCDAPGYPIVSGAALESLYQRGRATFVYDLAAYDAAVIVTDAADNAASGLRDLAAALAAHGTRRLFFVTL